MCTLRPGILTPMWKYSYSHNQCSSATLDSSFPIYQLNGGLELGLSRISTTTPAGDGKTLGRSPKREPPRLVVPDASRNRAGGAREPEMVPDGPFPQGAPAAGREQDGDGKVAFTNQIRTRGSVPGAGCPSWQLRASRAGAGFCPRQCDSWVPALCGPEESLRLTGAGGGGLRQVR